MEFIFVSNLNGGDSLINVDNIRDVTDCTTCGGDGKKTRITLKDGYVIISNDCIAVVRNKILEIGAKIA